MPAFVSTLGLPLRTLTDAEQELILRVTGAHRDGFRDHIIIAFALGTALREAEIAALNIGDVLRPDARIKRQFPLRVFKRSNMDVASQWCTLPDSLRYKLGKYVAWKRDRGENLAPDAPLFLSRLDQRIATRTLRLLFATWQKRAGFERIYNFHSLRHTALTELFRRTRDVRIVQAVARHRSVESSMVYIRPSNQEVVDAIRVQRC